ncbi:MAG: hypothetical protein WCI01_08990 [Chlorobiaceae bacterium]
MDITLLPCVLHNMLCRSEIELCRVLPDTVIIEKKRFEMFQPTRRQSIKPQYSPTESDNFFQYIYFKARIWL